MSCTAEEISEKRRIALERLKNRKLNINPAVQSTVAVQPVQNSTNAATSPKSIVSFYGSTTNVKTNQLSAYENKIRESPTKKIANRILSQPYSNRNNGSGPSASTITKLAPVFTTSVTCTCSLISACRFQVITSGYFARLIDVFKTIPSRTFSRFPVAIKIYTFSNILFLCVDNDAKVWSFGLNDYESVQEKVSHLNPDVVIGSLPKFVINLMRQGM